MSSETTKLPGSENLDDETLDGSLSEENSDPKPQDSELEESVSPKKKNGLGKWVFLLVLILLVGAAAGGWYYSQEQFRQLQAGNDQQLNTQLAVMEQEIEGLRTQIVSQSERQESVESSLLASVSETESQLLSMAQRVTQSESTGTGDWELAEAEYLLRIANQRLVTSQDIAGALEMMSAADNILRELAYPELTQARRQLVADFTRLSNIQPVDYEGIYFALDALLPLVSDLSGLRVERLTNPTDQSADESSVAGYWALIVDALSPYIIINSSADSASQYLVSDEQEALAKSEVQLLIRQAQLAMLAGEEELYERALTNAGGRIAEVFSADSETDSLVSTIRSYSGRTILSESVDISRSIRAVETVVDQLTRVQQFEP